MEIIMSSVSSKMIFCIISVILSVDLLLCSMACVQMDLSLTQKIENEGFHRDIFWLLEIFSPDGSTWENSDCCASIRLDVPGSMFVNPDQIADLNRVNEFFVYVDGQVDIEKPAHESEEHRVLVFFPNNITHGVTVSLPIHLRYHRAQITGGYTRAVLPKPSILVRCKKDEICGEYPNLRYPCDERGPDNCLWKNVTYQGISEETEMLVPIGDLDDYSYVSVCTLLLGCAGCIYILSLLSTVPL